MVWTGRDGRGGCRVPGWSVGNAFVTNSRFRDGTARTVRVRPPRCDPRFHDGPHGGSLGGPHRGSPRYMRGYGESSCHTICVVVIVPIMFSICSLTDPNYPIGRIKLTFHDLHSAVGCTGYLEAANVIRAALHDSTSLSRSPHPRSKRVRRQRSRHRFMAGT